MFQQSISFESFFSMSQTNSLSQFDALSTTQASTNFQAQITDFQGQFLNDDLDPENVKKTSIFSLNLSKHISNSESVPEVKTHLSTIDQLLKDLIALLGDEFSEDIDKKIPAYESSKIPSQAQYTLVKTAFVFFTMSGYSNTLSEDDAENIVAIKHEIESNLMPIEQLTKLLNNVLSDTLGIPLNSAFSHSPEAALLSLESRLFAQASSSNTTNQFDQLTDDGTDSPEEVEDITLP